ncbi:MAG: hypothetical protein GY940_15335 [bacterium]|nr:hypothetical protein [bacterium]
MISLISLYLFSTFHQSPPGMKIDPISPFKITKISGNGKIYFDKNRIDSDDLTVSKAKPLDIKQMQYQEEMYIKSDAHTSFEFYCFGLSFVVLPGSYAHFRPQTTEFHFISGEFYWQKETKEEAKGKAVEISIREPQNLLGLSDSGRVKVRPGSIGIWNYTGTLKFNYNNEDYTLKDNQYLVASINPRARTVRPPVISNILPFPQQIDPLNKVIRLNNPQASVVKFDWRVVKDNPQYKFKLYSSDLKENVLLERTVKESDLTLDLLQFEEREFFWEVFPVGGRNRQEGNPSKLGHIKMIGSLLEKKNVQKPPELNIKSLTRNGNLIIMEGTADVNARLYINDQLISLDLDGGFIHTLTFKTIGPKKIIFRLVSPLGVETVKEENVTIYAE